MKELKVGFFFFLAIIIAAIAIIKIKHIDFGNNFYTVYTYFDTITGIEKNSPVKLAGMKIGRVEEILQDEKRKKIKIVMKINNQYKISADATAKLQMENIMGAKHISISFGKSETYLKNEDYIKSVDEIDIERLIISVTKTAEEAKNLITDFNTNQSKVLNKVYAILNENQSKIKSFINNIDLITTDAAPKIANITTYIDSAMPDLHKSIENIQNITLALREGKGALGKVINDPKLYDELLIAAENIKSSFGRLEKLIARNEDNIDSIIISIKQTIEPVKASFNNIAVITEKIKNGEGTIGKLVNDTALYNSTKQTVEKLNENLEDQREQSVMSSFTNTIFGIFKF